MSNLLLIKHENVAALPVLVERAATALANAKTSAEVLEARDMASVAYDAAKKAARFAKAKGAHDDLISAVYRSQADAAVIEAQAKCRLADEYDAAQARGEITRHGENRFSKFRDQKLNWRDVAANPREINEIRELRDAEAAEPGIVRRTVDDAIANREEPTKAKVRKAVNAVAKRAKPKKDNKAKAKKKKAAKTSNPPTRTETRHQRDLRVLLSVWETTCISARAAFLSAIKNVRS